MVFPKILDCLERGRPCGIPRDSGCEDSPPVIPEQLKHPPSHLQTRLTVRGELAPCRRLMLQSLGEESTAVPPPLVVLLARALSSPGKAIPIQQLAPLQFRAKLVQCSPERCQLQPLNALVERPQLAGLEGHAAAHLIRHASMIVPALVQEQQPTHSERQVSSEPPVRDRVRCDPDCRLICQPMRSSAARTRRAGVADHGLTTRPRTASVAGEWARRFPTAQRARETPTPRRLRWLCLARVRTPAHREARESPRSTARPLPFSISMVSFMMATCTHRGTSLASRFAATGPEPPPPPPRKITH